MSIATKLVLLLTAVTGVFCAGGAASYLQVRHLSQTFNELLSSAVEDMDRARVIQVDFKKQVQEWKDILLRGHNPADLEKYTRQFHEKESSVVVGAGRLADSIRDPDAHGLLIRFQSAHRAMSAKYAQAYAIYVAGHADFKRADALVRGQDRAPTDLFDQVVDRLRTRVKNSVEMERTAGRQAQAIGLSVAGGMLLLICVLGVAIVRSVVGRLAKLKAVSDRLARADLEGLAIPITGRDEIGKFAESMRGVHAAFEELFKLAAATAVPVTSNRP